MFNMTWGMSFDLGQVPLLGSCWQWQHIYLSAHDIIPLTSAIIQVTD
jgi:hypothetical protein